MKCQLSVSKGWLDFENDNNRKNKADQLTLESVLSYDPL